MHVRFSKAVKALCCRILLMTEAKIEEKLRQLALMVVHSGPWWCALCRQGGSGAEARVRTPLRILNACIKPPPCSEERVWSIDSTTILYSCLYWLLKSRPILTLGFLPIIYFTPALLLKALANLFGETFELDYFHFVRKMS